MWARKDISFELENEVTSHPIVTIRIKTPDGVMLCISEPEERGDTLVLNGFHLHSVGDGERANSHGMANLFLIAQVILETMDFQSLHIIGGTRTTGKFKGRTPSPFTIPRREPKPSADDEIAATNSPETVVDEAEEVEASTPRPK